MFEVLFKEWSNNLNPNLIGIFYSRQSLWPHRESSYGNFFTSNVLILFLSFVGNIAPQIQASHVNDEWRRDSNEKYLWTETKCSTQGCLRTAEKIRNYFDESKSPCENFYEFACGNYIENKNIPRGQGSIDEFSDVEDLVSRQLWPIISEPIQLKESKPIRLAKDFYASCINQDEFTEERTIKQMVDILDEFGGWPVLKGDTWQERNFDWVETVKQFRELGLNANAIFSLNIGIDLKNSSKRVLTVSSF